MNIHHSGHSFVVNGFAAAGLLLVGYLFG